MEVELHAEERGADYFYFEFVCGVRLLVKELVTDENLNWLGGVGQYLVAASIDNDLFWNHNRFMVLVW